MHRTSHLWPAALLLAAASDLGAAARAQTLTLFAKNGAHAGDRLGSAVAGVGDVDGDGVPDVAVGAPREDVAPPKPFLTPNLADAGTVRIYSGADGALVRLHKGPAAADRLGSALVGTGDVDLDGTPDYAVGAPQAAWFHKGYVRVCSGATGALIATILGTYNAEAFGSALAAIDADQDGRPDLIVGAPTYSGTLIGRGRVALHSSANWAQVHSWPGEAAGDHLGHSVAGLGDVNGDGQAEILAGAPYADVFGLTDVGVAYVYSSATGGLVRKHNGTGRTGHGVAGLGDVDGDSVADYALGSPLADLSKVAQDRGAVHAYSGATGASLWSHHWVVPGTQFGFSVALAGDVDGDGRTDVIVGAPMDSPAYFYWDGDAMVLSGTTSALYHGIEYPTGLGGDAFGTSVAGVGDIDQDGGSDLVAGAPGRDQPATDAGHVRVVRGVPLESD